MKAGLDVEGEVVLPGFHGDACDVRLEARKGSGEGDGVICI
jgi:hypothetical protein